MHFGAQYLLLLFYIKQARRAYPRFSRSFLFLFRKLYSTVILVIAQGGTFD